MEKKALLAILQALRRAVQRDLGALWSLKVNNFFFFVMLLVAGALSSGLPPWSAYPFLALLALLLLVPASSDPLEKIPAERLSSWPLGRSDRVALRLLSLALSPVFWLLAFTRAWPVLPVLIALRLVIRLPRLTRIPPFPLLAGRLGGMITNNVREMLSLPDTWLAILLSLLGIAFRLSGARADPEALSIFAILIALALSTWAQSLFGLDPDSAMTRYRLLPLAGWQVLLAKDLAFLGILLLLALPLRPLPALTFGLMALAIGHHSSVRLNLAQKRWRFTAGRLLPVGALQALASVAAAFWELRSGPQVLAGVLCLYLCSLYFYGRSVK